MAGAQRDGLLRIGEVAARAGVSADTVRYYERLGLLRPPARGGGGYRLYSEVELRRLQLIRRAKRLGMSLDEIRSLLGVAGKGECRLLRRQVAELLRQKIAECEVRLAELEAFKTSLEERYRLVLGRQDEPPCSCANFPLTCGCLPAELEGLDSSDPRTFRPGLEIGRLGKSSSRGRHQGCSKKGGGKDGPE